MNQMQRGRQQPEGGQTGKVGKTLEEVKGRLRNLFGGSAEIRGRDIGQMLGKIGFDRTPHRGAKAIFRMSTGEMTVFQVTFNAATLESSRRIGVSAILGSVKEVPHTGVAQNSRSQHPVKTDFSRRY